MTNNILIEINNIINRMSEENRKSNNFFIEEGLKIINSILSQKPNITKEELIKELEKYKATDQLFGAIMIIHLLL
jgi:hypothetical protein